MAAGHVSRGQLRGPGFRRLFSDVYISAGVALTHYHWCRAAVLYAGEGAVIGGRSAANL